ncbi:NUDIX domain-containing protein [Microbacterium sp. G2-8]|uniref:NUDIX hydrolase n=1 Tax=Microbacterium sp. G2-8 TaxID=2842454 RepID=UPI001C898E64|nr:NUDIX domain-containing protein [Microbacterium sp. G2-8]
MASARTGSSSRTRQKSTVYAAGGVMWRYEGDRLLVLLVERTKFRDVSFPKGKVDPGETLPETAVRELEEETGVRGSLGPSLGTVQYHMPSGREKVVQYWAVETTPEALKASTFQPNKEISALQWVTPGKARKKLSYPIDRQVLDGFEQLVAAGGLGTFALVLMRHGQAESLSSAASDAERALTPRGEKQAHGAVGPLRAFGVRRIISSTARRCVQTVTPVSRALGQRIHDTDLISQDAWERSDGDVPSIVDKRIRKAKPAVLCSHGPVIPQLMEAIAEATSTPFSRELSAAASLRTGAFTVVHVSRADPSHGIVAIESHASTA